MDHSHPSPSPCRQPPHSGSLPGYLIHGGCMRTLTTHRLLLYCRVMWISGHGFEPRETADTGTVAVRACAPCLFRESKKRFDPIFSLLISVRAAGHALA